MRHISTSTAERKHILSAMDRHIEVAKAKVKSEEPKSEWTFEQVQEAFKHQVELDRVRHSSRVLSWHPNHASKTLRRLSGGPSVMSEQFLLWKKIPRYGEKLRWLCQAISSRGRTPAYL